MGQIGSVNATFTASVGGLTAGVDAAGKAFKALGGDTASLRSSLATLQKVGAKSVADIGPAATTAGAAAARLREQAAALGAAFASGSMAAEDFRRSMALVTTQSTALAAAVTAGSNVTRANMTAQQTHAETMAELNQLLASGAVSQETYARASAAAAETLAQADGSAAAAAAALNDLSAVHARGAAVARANMTAEEQYAAAIAELNQLLAAGAISQETYSRASAAAADKMRDAGGAAGQMDSWLAGITSRLNVLIGIDVIGFLGSIASSISGTISSLIGMGQAEAGVITQTSKMAARFGITYGEMAGLSLAAERAGVGLESMKDAMTKADVALGRAAGGSAEAAAGFESIGLSAAQLNAMSPADRFQAISQAIAKLPTEAQRAAAAVRVFGQSGTDLLPIFEGGADALTAAREEAERFGTALTTAQGNDVKAMTSSFETAKTAIQGVVQQVTAYLAPAVTGVVNQFNQFIGDIGGANIGQAIGDGILAGAEFLAGIGDWLINALSGVFEFFSQVSVNWGVVVDYFNRAVSFFSGIFNSVQAGLGAIILGFGSVFQKLAEVAQSIGKFLGFDTKSIDAIVAGAQAFNDTVSAGITENTNAAARDFSNAFGESAASAGQAAAGPLTTAVRGFRAAARESASAIDEATANPVVVTQTTTVAGVTEALKAVDSRSKEGVAEMFRIMRGGGNDVQEQQLSALNRIAENTGGMEAMPLFSMAGA